jgi:hypothetical protein
MKSHGPTPTTHHNGQRTREIDQDTGFIIKFSGIQKCNILREITDINKKKCKVIFRFGGEDGRSSEKGVVNENFPNFCGAKCSRTANMA